MDWSSFLKPWLIWFVLAVILALLELGLPGLVVIFFALGCLITSAVTLIWDVSLTIQITVFIISSIASLLLLRRYVMTIFAGNRSDSDDGYNDFPAGVKVKVTRPITPNENGQISYRGTIWEAAADEDIAEGETVRLERYADDSRLVYFVSKV